LEPEPILFVCAEERGRAFTARWRGLRPTYWCVLAHTDTCLLTGISSAGLSEELRPLTPAADAEVVLLGAPVCLPLLPSNPLGTPGPAGITRAALGLAGVEARFIGAGLRLWPETECLRLSDTPGASIEHGFAVADAEALFEAGQRLGHEAARSSAYLILG
jgi:NaMN:DMB phosphoribosyltransferase